MRIVNKINERKGDLFCCSAENLGILYNPAIMTTTGGFMQLNTIWKHFAGGAYLAAAALLFLLSAAGVSHAEEGDRYFNNLLIFGDSLLDSGNLGLVFTDPADSATNAPGEVVSDYFAARLGITTATPSVNGGSNYAVAGSNAQQILAVVTTYTGANSIDNRSIVYMNGSGNNLTISNIILMPEMLTLAGGLIGTAALALHMSGAQHIIVSNIPDAALAPGSYRGVGCTAISSPACDAYIAASASFSGGAAALNTGLSLGINGARAAGGNIIVADSEMMLDHVLANPTRYGFPDLGAALHQSCYGYDPDPRILPGNDNACITNPTYGRGQQPSDDPTQLIFADNFHPTQRFHALNADYLYDIVYAPTEVALLPEIGIYGVRHQTEGIVQHLRLTRDGKLKPLRLSGAAEGNETPLSNCFADFNVSRDNLGSNGPAAQGDISATGLSFGCDSSIGGYRVGLAGHLAQGELDISGRRSTYELNQYGLAAYMGYTQQRLFINGIVALSRVNIDATRHYLIGGGAFSASGKTEGFVWSGELIGGYDLLAAHDHIKLAPAVGILHRRSRVNGYSESGNGISNYRWGDLENTSRQYRAGVIGGYQVADNVLINADVFWVQETDNSFQQVRASQANDTTNTYRLPAFQRDDEGFEQLHLDARYLLADQNGIVALAWDYSGQADGSHGVRLLYKRRF